jgi:hypothetical protein
MNKEMGALEADMDMDCYRRKMLTVGELICVTYPLDWLARRLHLRWWGNRRGAGCRHDASAGVRALLYVLDSGLWILEL